MKILSLWQPHASFIPIGWKKWETRGRSTSYRGPLAIHAAKTTEGLDRVWEILVDAGLKASMFDPDPPELPKDDEWPLGAIVAVCRIVDCIRTEDAKPSRLERAMGNYSEKRFAWILEDVKSVKPFPYRGTQIMVDLPADVESRLEIVAA